MSDIAANLIKIADASRRAEGSDIPLGEQCRFAADEITRLRAALALYACQCTTPCWDPKSSSSCGMTAHKALDTPFARDGKQERPPHG